MTEITSVLYWSSMFARYLSELVQDDLQKKMVFVSGPRQVGKATLARSLDSRAYYLNFDVVKDRVVIQKQAWDSEAPLLILDELHKLNKWKRWLKGVWDSDQRPQKLLVTGSARFDTFRKGGESLAGRFFHHHLHPFSVAELTVLREIKGGARRSTGSRQSASMSAEEALDLLLVRGGFPEPLFAKSDRDAARWRLSHLDRIVRDDVDAIERVTDLRQLELLVELLSTRVGSALSYRSLSEDLSVSAPTVKRWIAILEALYVVFLVRPYAKSHARAIRKEPKLYFYDIGRVEGDEGVRFENLVACHLQKRNDFLTASTGSRHGLFYVRDKEKREVDFLTTLNGKPELLLEAKLTDEDPSRSLKYYSELLNCSALQLVKNAERDTRHSGIRMLRAAPWLAVLEA